ncbi:hypothetical protein MNBD_GAMMA16-1620 [hydrothermal vent metagenome]|uniref:O-antigen ligase-related domain-containing protein n=1 Tax=hydrothermal vent metagenome TaxID=652676 RepID=A0A3B0YU99_9ZZZZ
MFTQYRILIAPSIFLFILPFTHTVALRLSMLGIAFLTALYIWHKEEHPSLPLKLPLLLTALISLASVFWAIDPSYSFGEVKNELGYTFLAFFTFFILTKSDRELRVFGGALLVGTIVMISLGLGAYLMEGRWNETGYQGGVHDFSTYVVFMIPVLIFACFYTKRLYCRLTIIALTSLLIVAGYFTLQRIMWPGIAVVLLTVSVLLIAASSLHKIIKITSGIVVLFICIALLPVGLTAKNNTPYTSLSGMYDVIKNDPRVDGIWGASITGIEQAPLLGVGYGRRSFVKAYPELKVDLGWHTHNIILDKTVQTGIIGAIIFTFLMACIIRQFWLAFRASLSREMLLLSLCGIALVLAMLIVNMTNHSFVRHSSLLFWSLLGISLGYSFRQKKPLSS